MIDRFDLVVFDWDGTLVDSTALIAAAIRQAAADLGLTVPDFERASHVIGLGLADALARAVPELPSSRFPEFAARYRAHYLAGENQIALFPQVRGLLDALRERGVPLAIATGKTRAGLARALDSAGLALHFSATRCADETAPKPDPAMLFELAGELDVAVSRMVMIGDTTHDLQMAAAAGVAAVGVTYGAHPRVQLAALEPLALLDSVPALRGWLIPG
ncbi:MAG TPA: HAD-IA family hydrolase [Burkholderiaceae bacterium]